MVEVELLQGFAGREACGADTTLTAVGFAGRDLALQAGDQEFLMAPRLRLRPFCQPVARVTQGRCFQRPSEERDVDDVTRARLRAHQDTTPVSKPNAAS